MEILLCLVSEDYHARELVNRAQGALVPKTFRERPSVKDRNPTFDVRATGFTGNHTVEDLISNELGRWSGICLISDELERLPGKLRSTCFTGAVERGASQADMVGAATSLLANYFEVLKYALAKGTMEALALPIANFDAAELRELVELVSDRAQSPTFAQDFTGLLAKLQRRYAPKRPKDGDDRRYYQDDARKHFDYGTEDHGQFDTGHPHVRLCEISGNFRFGCRISTRHHYNMMGVKKKKTWIKGTFEGCHGHAVQIPGQSHVNIFANDFHKRK